MTGVAAAGRGPLADRGSAGTDSALAARLRLAVGRLHRRLSRTTGPGLTASQLSALVTVEQHGPMRVGDLAAREGVSPPTVTRIATSLEALGLLERTVDPADGRASRLVASAAGGAALESVRRERTAFLAERLDRLPPSDRAALVSAVEVLERLVEDD